MKNRRGLSSVVGAVFAIIAMATTVGYITYSMNVLDNYNQAALARTQQMTEIANEKFQVTGATFVNNKLNITVANTGTLPVNFTKIWITNSSTPNTNAWVKSYSINKIASPGNTLTNIGQGVTTWLNTGYSYNVKLVTSRGNSLPFFINSVSQQPLDIQVFTSPSTVSNQFDTAVIMTVANNATNAGTITNLQPQVPSVDISTCTPSCIATLASGPIPPSYPVLQPGQTATFRWEYTITGAATNTITFTTGVLNGGSVNTKSANVVVRDIVSSLTSGSTLTSKGVGSSSTQNNTLFMHTETNIVPSARFQVMPPFADTSGSTYNDFKAPSLSNIQFFTKNASSGTTLMYAGTMNASFRYTHNDKVPANVTLNDDAGQMLHFNTQYSGCGSPPCDRPVDSEKSGNDCWNTPNTASWKPSSSYRPTVSTTYGINGTNGAYFGGSHFYDLAVDGNCNSPGSSRFSLTTWFKADVNANNHVTQTIWRLGTGSNDYYEIVIGDGTSGNHGKIFFNFDTGASGSGGKFISCASDIPAGGGYMDGKWHHLAAVRTGSYAGQLFIDGVSKNTCTVSSGTDNTISPAGEVSIGRKPASSSSCSCTSPYIGALDDMMFWNNDHALSTNEVKSMYHANYGSKATLIGMVLDKTDKNGVKLSNIIPLTYKYVPFVDEQHYSSTSTSPDRNYYWAGGNYTISVPQITLSPGQRLNYTFLQYSGSSLAADVRVDDKNFDGIGGNLYSSFIQYPKSNSTMPSYLQYNRCTALDVLVYNEGPYGSWTTYQGTRVTFDDLNNLNSYAGIIHYVNGSSLSSSQDSIFLPVGSTNTFEFYPIQSRPDQNGNQFCGTGTIPDGNFDMNLFISGYDEHGGSFLRQVSFGTVYVYG